MLKPRNWKAATVALMAVTLLSACGKKTFKKLEQSSSGIAGQYNYIKPKLDLVIFQDNSPSFNNIMGQVKPQLASFLANLDSRWEYRVVVMPLLSANYVQNKYAVATNCTGVPAGQCLLPSQSHIFNSDVGDAGWINTVGYNGNLDQGFYNMYNNLVNLGNSGFIRSDSTLVTMVISNNDDHTDVDTVTRPDGTTLVSVDYNSARTQNSFNYYRNLFQTYRSSQQRKMYAVVSYNGLSDCWGGGQTWMGKRYADLAAVIGGGTFDLCSGGLQNVLGSLSTQLVTIVQTIEFDYLVFPEEPDPATITVKKNGSTLPQSNVNGWTYVGYRTGATSFYPAPGNVRSGYMVKLNGSATLKGTDTYELVYTKK